MTDNNNDVNEGEPSKEAIQAVINEARNKSADFLEQLRVLKMEGRSERNMASYLGLSVSQLRSCAAIAKNELRKEEQDAGVAPQSFPVIDTNDQNPNKYLDKARELVLKHYNRFYLDKGEDLHISEVYVVWFSKTLQNWKALVATEVIDNLYFEVTHNGDKNETYLDAYRKVSNEVITETVSHSRYGQSIEPLDLPVPKLAD